MIPVSVSWDMAKGTRSCLSSVNVWKCYLNVCYIVSFQHLQFIPSHQMGSKWSPSQSYLSSVGEKCVKIWFLEEKPGYLCSHGRGVRMSRSRHWSSNLLSTIYSRVELTLGPSGLSSATTYLSMQMPLLADSRRDRHRNAGLKWQTLVV